MRQLSGYRKKACHRSWAPRNAPISGGHCGDIMSAEKRSALMSRIRGKNTGPEKIIVEALSARSLLFHSHVATLAGRPDIVFPSTKVAVFIDGDFWHGWRFPLWKNKLAMKWQVKIEANRRRDQRNFRSLRQLGWQVIRVWEHQIEQKPDACLQRILRAISQA